jgi:hypothetical protein
MNKRPCDTTAHRTDADGYETNPAAAAPRGAHPLENLVGKAEQGLTRVGEHTCACHHERVCSVQRSHRLHPANDLRGKANENESKNVPIRASSVDDRFDWYRSYLVPEPGVFRIRANAEYFVLGPIPMDVLEYSGQRTFVANVLCTELSKQRHAL